MGGNRALTFGTFSIGGTMNLTKLISVEGLVPILALLSSLLFLGGCSDVNSPPDSQSTPATALETPNVKAANSHSPSHEGNWKATAATLAGAPFPSSVTDSIALTVTGEQYEVNVGGNPDKGKCTVDRTTSPNRMTITGTDGPNAGKTFLAVFDFPEANQMRVCYDLTGAAFPNTFKSTADNGLFLVVYSRTN